MSLLPQKLPINHLLSILPIIEENLPIEKGNLLCSNLKKIVNDENAAKNGKLSEFVDFCCGQKPTQFNELVAFAMLSVGLELTGLPVTSSTCELKKKFLFQTFQMPIEAYAADFQKIYVIAESLWSISSNTMNINHIIFCLHDCNRFTYNVSIALICAAFNQLVKDTPNTFELANLNSTFVTIANSNIRTTNAKTMDMLFNFVVLFNTFQSVYWRNYDRPALHPHLAAHMESDICTAQISILLHDLKNHLNKSIRDNNLIEKQIMMHQLIELILADLDKMVSVNQPYY